jgi:hypothetical protein
LKYLDPGAGEGSKLAVGATILGWKDYIYFFFIIGNTYHVFYIYQKIQKG